MVLGMPPKKLILQLIPAPPGLRIFRPLMSSAVFNGFVVVYQFWNPRSIQGPMALTRSLVSSCLTTKAPGLPSEAFSVASTGWP